MAVPAMPATTATLSFSQPSDGTASHPIRLSNYDSLVAGYPGGQPPVSRSSGALNECRFLESTFGEDAVVFAIPSCVIQRTDNVRIARILRLPIQWARLTRPNTIGAVGSLRASVQRGRLWIFHRSFHPQSYKQAFLVRLALGLLLFCSTHPRQRARAASTSSIFQVWGNCFRHPQYLKPEYWRQPKLTRPVFPP